MPVLADFCSMAKTDIKSKGFLYHVYTWQMQRNAVYTLFLPSFVSSEVVCTEGKHSCCAVSWGGWRVGIPVCWTDGLTWRATDHAVTSSLTQHVWPADAKLGRKSLLRYLSNTLSHVFLPSLRVALH